MTRYLFLLLLPFVCWACKKVEPTHHYIKTTQVYKTMSGVDENLLSLDIYAFTDDTLRPVVFWVHGGGWSIGDKENNLTTKLNWAYEQGYTFVSTNYRLTDNNGVQFPDHPNDVADALAWTYQNIHLYGGDSAHIGLMGHSAGAHLVALVSTDNQYLTERGLPLNTIKGTVCLDTEGYDVRAKLTDEPNNRMYGNAFGNNPSQWDQASPLYHVNLGTNSIPRFFLVTRGSKARVNVAETFRDALLARGVPVQLVNANPYSHSKVNDKAGDPNDDKFTPLMTVFYQTVFPY